MASDSTNLAVLEQLQDFARLYFDAIIEANTADGVCSLGAGRYSAKEMADNSYKNVFGHAYLLPEDDMYDEPLTITAGTFSCTFIYRNIFTMLAAWETMMRAGRRKAVFEIGGIEERTARVIIDETTPTGKFVEKRVRLQRVSGSWWVPRKRKPGDLIPLYYDLNGVIFFPGRHVHADKVFSESTVAWCEDNEPRIVGLLLSMIDRRPGHDYWHEVATRAGLTAQEQPAETPAETPAHIRDIHPDPSWSDRQRSDLNHYLDWLRTYANDKDKQTDIVAHRREQPPQSVAAAPPHRPPHGQRCRHRLHHRVTPAIVSPPRITAFVTPRDCVAAITPHGAPRLINAPPW